MKKSLLIILSLLIGFSAVARKHKHKKKNDIISVSMRRTGCYGKCPDYIVKIDNTGMATYTGNRFVTDTGTFQKNIGATQAMTIINEANTYQVDTCQDSYYNRISDLPGIILTVQYATHTKRINNAHFGPHFLVALAGDIELAGKKTDSTGWSKVSAGK
jgi:hypothetical protein